MNLLNFVVTTAFEVSSLLGCFATSARKQTPEFHRGTMSPSSGSSSPPGLLGPLEEGIVLLQNVSTHLPVYIVQHQRRLETSIKMV
jgi:hypothetical protein